MHEKLTNEIALIQQQANHHLELYQQAVGAINALRWALAQLPEETLTVQQIAEAIERGAQE